MRVFEEWVEVIVRIGRGWGIWLEMGIWSEPEIRLWIGEMEFWPSPSGPPQLDYYPVDLVSFLPGIPSQQIFSWWRQLTCFLLHFHLLLPDALPLILLLMCHHATQKSILSASATWASWTDLCYPSSSWLQLALPELLTDQKLQPSLFLTS